MSREFDLMVKTLDLLDKALAATTQAQAVVDKGGTMSYWSHNPEKYSELCNNAIARKLASYHPEMTDELQIDLRLIVDEMEHDAKARAVRDMLLSWAHEEIMVEEQDYWGSLADSAKEQAEARAER